jgi:hypothetical protein
VNILNLLREGLLNAIHGIALVCPDCLRATDNVRGPAGDFSLCERCGASITSVTGKTIRRAPGGV